MSRGSNHYAAKLTEEDVALIHEATVERKRLRSQAYQLSNQKLAEKFEVHVRTIEKAISGKTWSNA